MGDYNSKGDKIGTCGKAYYATFKMLQADETPNSDVRAYLNPSNSCSAAFPFPEYDDKKIGEISQFHTPIDYTLKLRDGFNYRIEYVGFYKMQPSIIIKHMDSDEGSFHVFEQEDIDDLTEAINAKIEACEDVEEMKYHFEIIKRSLNWLLYGLDANL